MKLKKLKKKLIEARRKEAELRGKIQGWKATEKRDPRLYGELNAVFFDIALLEMEIKNLRSEA